MSRFVILATAWIAVFAGVTYGVFRHNLIVGVSAVAIAGAVKIYEAAHG